MTAADVKEVDRHDELSGPGTGRPIDDPLPDGAPLIDDPSREVPAVDPPRRDAPGPVREPQGPRRDPSPESFQPKE